jgi:adenine deaminase
LGSRKRLIDIAAGRESADTVLKNCKIISVFTNEIIEGDIAIADGKIAGVGSYSGTEEVDVEGKYVSPSFIDGHVHIESSMVSPYQFSKQIVPRGTTAIVADPHEIANVSGIAGIEYILDATESLPLDAYVMLPSCVPATDNETSGAVLKAEDLKKLIDHPRVLGLGELMDFVGVVNGNPDIIDKLEMAQGKIVDGHGPLIEDRELNAYVAAGVKTEHECSTLEEMKERLRRGMYIQIREGTAARNLGELILGVDKDNIRRCIFCTDDKHPEDLLNRGHIDNNVRLAIKSGIEPIDAIKMASLNPAECYGLDDRGAIAPGYRADLVVFSDLEDIKIEKVYKNGVLSAENGKLIGEYEEHVDERTLSRVNIDDYSEDKVDLKLKSGNVNVIKLIDHSLVTSLVERKVAVKDGSFVYNKDEDISKLVLVERHTGRSTTFVALLEGYGIENGAIGTTIAHDSHNIIVVGDNDRDIVKCINHIKSMGGGIAISSGGEIKGCLELKVGGLMSTEDIESVNEKLEAMMKVAREHKVSEGVDPFMTLSFLALPVIPDVKITDKGLFDVVKFKFIDINRV